MKISTYITYSFIFTVIIQNDDDSVLESFLSFHYKEELQQYA
jgi:hypothetical protein